ncbi:translation initiation factor IF-2 [Patescibacteria group bacterium]|nr:translation initiation factor IF-2 [Patescibacteria group bacterium]
MNITELARKVKITPAELRQKLPELGFHIGKRAIQIPNKQAEKFIEIWRAEQSKQAMLNKIKQKISKTEEKEKQVEKELISIPSKIQVHRFAAKINIPLNKVMNELVKNGVFCGVNENIDYEIAAIVAENIGIDVQPGDEEQVAKVNVKAKINKILKQEKKENLKQRPPIIVMVGHVDHGKSSILDAIRKSKITEIEQGGITQHIGSYQVEKNEHLMTFIDTPGHEAFKQMRVRGGGLADIAILVISADDKIQPQTMESIKIIHEENIPFVVAINKIDKSGADIDKIKKELSEINLMPEDWGGKIICIPVSAKTTKGINDLLDAVNIIIDLNKSSFLANPTGEMIGVVVESRLDPGLGPIMSSIILNGHIQDGDNLIVGNSYGKVRFIQDYLGNKISKTKISLPVDIFGLKNVPSAGTIIKKISSDKEFKKITKQISSIKSSHLFFQEENEQEYKDTAEAAKNTKQLKIILKANKLGSLEAIIHSIENLSTDEVKVKILKKGIGQITETDVDLASASNAYIFGFEVNVSGLARNLIKEKNVKVELYNVIYDLIEFTKEQINKLLPEEVIEEFLGEVKILKIFQKKNKEKVVGGKVLKGKVNNNRFIRIWESSEQGKQSENRELTKLKGEGKITQLQFNKNDVDEAGAGKECGLKIITQANIEPDDILEIYKEVKKQRKI